MSLILGRHREERRAAIDELTASYRSDIADSIRAIQSGTALMKTHAGINKLVRDAGRGRDQD